LVFEEGESTVAVERPKSACGVMAALERPVTATARVGMRIEVVIVKLKGKV
jgi:hypothetical protein